MLHCQFWSNRWEFCRVDEAWEFWRNLEDLYTFLPTFAPYGSTLLRHCQAMKSRCNGRAARSALAAPWSCHILPSPAICKEPWSRTPDVPEWMKALSPAFDSSQVGTQTEIAWRLCVEMSWQHHSTFQSSLCTCWGVCHVYIQQFVVRSGLQVDWHYPPLFHLPTFECRRRDHDMCNIVQHNVDYIQTNLRSQLDIFKTIVYDACDAFD